MANEEIKDKNTKSNYDNDNDNDNFFLRNTHLLIAMIWMYRVGCSTSRLNGATLTKDVNF